jgi:starvation-inducible DNA-binding protein
MYDTRIDLSISIREKVVPMLQARLADSVDLFTQIKQAHWNVKGPHFTALHDLFDKIAEIVERQADMLAERITALVSASILRPSAATPPLPTSSRKYHAQSTSNCGWWMRTSKLSTKAEE